MKTEYIARVCIVAVVRALGTALVVLLLSSVSFAGVTNGSVYKLPSTAPQGAETVKVTVTVTPLGGAKVSTSSASGASAKVAGQQSAAGGPEVDDTERDMTASGKNKAGEKTKGNTTRVKGGKMQYKDKNGKWVTVKPQKEPVAPSGGGSGTAGTVPK